MLWLLVITPTQIYSGKKKQAEQKEVKDALLEERKNTEKCNVGAKACIQGDKIFKEKTDGK